MRTFVKTILLCALLGGAAHRGLGFSIHGPFETWQVRAIGHQLSNDIAGVKSLPNAYRWNVPVITYAFDQSFLYYFGTNGVNAVDSAMALLNAVTNAGEINLNDYPLESRRQNYLARDAGLLDVRSVALVAVLEEIGLSCPERWVWAIRERFPTATFTNYLINKYNYDPLTWQSSSYVNGNLYSYVIADPVTDGLGATLGYADAVEYWKPDPYTPKATSVAGGFYAAGGLGYGDVYTGLTRDDVGGLRFLLNTNVVFNEALIPGVTGYTNTNNMFLTGWIPWFGGTNANANFSNSYFMSNYLARLGTNATAVGTNATNGYITAGLRGGVSKLFFQNVTAQYDSGVGPGFTPFTNIYYETVLVTNNLIQQKMQRVVTAPDILFVVEDLPINANGRAPFLVDRTLAAAPAWVNNDPINGATVAGGPGVIAGPIRISFNGRLPYYFVSPPVTLEEDEVTGGTWASFDQSTNAPILYPQYLQLSIPLLLDWAKRGVYTP